jgi:surface glycoprotein (TIGR04207 family)
MNYKGVKACFLTAIMLLSVIAAGVTFTGSAAADVNSVGSATNLTAPQGGTSHTVSGIDLSSTDAKVTVAVPDRTGVDYSDATAQVGGTTVNDSLSNGENFTIDASDIDSSPLDLTIDSISTESAAIGSKLDYTIYQSGTSASVSFSVVATYADTGDGTASDPYEIDDWNDLDAVRADLDANYTFALVKQIVDSESCG